MYGRYLIGSPFHLTNLTPHITTKNENRKFGVVKEGAMPTLPLQAHKDLPPILMTFVHMLCRFLFNFFMLCQEKLY